MALLCNVAWAQTSFTFTRGESNAATVTAPEGLTATMVTNVDWLTSGAMSSNTGVLCPNKNTNATTAESPITFTLTVSGLTPGQEFTAASFTHKAVNSSGQFQGANNETIRHCNLTLTAGGEQVATLTNQNIWVPEGSADHDKVITFDNAFTADAEGNLTLTLTIVKGESNEGCFYGLTKIELHNTKVYTLNFISGAEVVESTTLTYIAGFDVPEDLINDAIPEGYHMLNYKRDGATYTVYVAEGAQNSNGPIVTFTNVQQDGTTTFTLYINENNELATSSSSAAELGDAAKFRAIPNENGKWAFYNESKGLYMIWRGKGAGHNGDKGVLAEYDATYCDWTMNAGTVSGTYYFVGRRKNNSDDGSLVVMKSNGAFDAWKNSQALAGNYSNLYKIESEEYVATLTDNQGTKITCTTKGLFPLPNYSTVALSNTKWANGRLTATVDATFPELPFPVSSAEETNPTFISSFKSGGGNYQGAGRFKWYAVEDNDENDYDDVKIQRDAIVSKATLASYSWAIYPSLENGALVYSIKSVALGKYIQATKNFGANSGDNNEGTVILSDTPTKFSVDNNNSLYYYTNGRNHFLSWGSVNTASGYLGVHTKTVSAGHNGITNSFHEPLYVLTKKADLESGAIYTFVTNRGWVGADERSTNLIGTAKSGLDPAPTPSNDNPMFQWALYQSQNGNYYLYNLGKKQFMGVQSADKGLIPFTATPTSKKLTFKDNGNATYPIMFSTDNQHAVTQNTASGLFGWKEGWNKTDDGGSNHKVTYIGELGADDLKTIADLVEAYDVLLPTTVTYTVDKENGDLYRGDGTINQNWNRDWKSKGEPQLVLSTGGKNNMNWQGNNVQLMTGDTKSTTYEFTAPEGYIITEYSFTFANNNHQTGLSLTMYNGDFYTTSTTPQTISEKNVYSSSVSFTLKGNNDNGVILTNFTVTVKKVVAEMPQFSTEEKQYWYYITSASTAGYCAGKVMYYDSNNQSLRFASKEFNGDYLWSFWKEGDKIAIKSYNGQYIGNGTNSAFGVVAEANYSYYIKEAYDFFIIKDDGTEMHAQENGSVIVRYGATDGGASLWNFCEADITNADAVLRSTKVEQGKVTTGIGNTHQPIVRSTIRVSGLTGGLNFQGVKGRFVGDSKTDVTKVRAYFATNDRELWLDPEQKMDWRDVNGVQYGDAVELDAEGNFTITGNKALTSGNHYLWITYDIAEDAKEGNLVDASITSYTIDDEEVTERNGNPSHSVTIFLSEGAVLMPMDKGSLYYRIPAITATKDGRLVVLTDDRKNHNTDLPSHCYLVAQYSDDLGKTWSDPLTVAGTAETGGDYGHGDASIVTDRNTGNIIGIMTSCGTYGHGFFGGTAEQPPLWKTIISEDGGETWSVPVDHTASLFGAACDNEKTKTWKSGFSGSGAALQKRDGTLVSSFVNREANDSQHFYLFMSKDGGQHWYVSGTSGTAAADEPKTLERNNGDLAISVRASGYNYHNVTSDNGATWHNPSQTRFNTGITGNACDGEYMVWCSTLEGNEWDIALQTLPNSSSRENVSIALSTDEGETFGAAKTICPRGSAYSATVVLPDGTLGVYYEENGLYGGYTMRFVRFSLDWASNGTYKFTNENPFKPIESVDPATVSTSINEHKIGTFYANDPVVIPDGVKAYVATEEPVMENGAGVITMTDLEDIIPAHTGVVLRAEKGDYTFKQAATNSGFVNGNMMRGYAGTAEYKTVALPTDGSVNYVLTVMDGKAGFYRKDAGFKVYNNKAYLNVPGAADARALYFEFDNGTTGIVETENESEKAEIYDLTGRRVQKVQKGLYIVNGKKVWK